jgi:hypothetical protein
MPTTAQASIDEIARGGVGRLCAVGVGQHAASVLTLRNLGGLSLDISKLAAQGDDQLTVSLDDSGVSSLAPGAATTFTVTFRPTVPGDVEALVSVVTNDPSGSYDFTVTGTGVRALYGVTVLPSAYRALARRSRAGVLP